ncbi:ArsR/SmtB family transcription factor [Aeromicrobium sp. Sec7.5]|uniref:ArsR/SmtB family transcription factor n=1 Tax=Aeromicrobium sp. Sec7.5 TaxID=3121276 RepID=UPI002FE4A6A8
MSTPVRPEQPEGVDRAIDMVGNRVKVAAIRSLLVDGPATQTELAERLSVQRSLLRKHLPVLEELGVVWVHPPREETDARRRQYSIIPAELEKTLTDLRRGLGLD